MQINGKRYDPGKAQECATIGAETLYRKRTGEYFTAATGGEIKPMNLEAAQEWARALDEKTYNRIFSVQSDGRKKLVSYTVDPATHEKIKRIAAQKGLPAGAVIDMIIKDLEI